MQSTKYSLIVDVRNARNVLLKLTAKLRGDVDVKKLADLNGLEKTAHDLYVLSNDIKTKIG